MKFSISMSAAVLAAVASNTLWIPGAHASPDSGKTVSLAALVNRSLQANPDVLAAQSAVDAAKARLGGTALPLHNPALEAEVESAGANTYQLGISQTIDWHDKRSAFEQLAQTEHQAVRQQLAALKLAKSTELLDAIGRIASQTGIKDLSQRRTQIMTRFANLAKQRHAAGDIPQAELELARLSLAESKMQLAGNQAELIQAHGDFFSLSGQMLTEKISLPANLKLHLVAAEDIESIARQHPEVQAAL
ncbi:MAG TPA: TolC family protein, partial [Chromatiaceae bacterium]|nr:TolC family protein [Chromatiaceae bacterium]